MYDIRTRHTLYDLADDLQAIPRAQSRRAQAIVRTRGKAGQQWARNDAEITAGEAGVHYPKSITLSVGRPRARFGGNAWSSIYGPDSALDQGGMDFEDGAGRQTSPHNNLAKSADVQGPLLNRDVDDMLDELFWLSR